MLKYLCWKTISNNILNQITSESVFKLTSNLYLYIKKCFKTNFIILKYHKNLEGSLASCVFQSQS